MQKAGCCRCGLSPRNVDAKDLPMPEPASQLVSGAYRLPSLFNPLMLAKIRERNGTPCSF